MTLNILRRLANDLVTIDPKKWRQRSKELQEQGDVKLCRQRLEARTMNQATTRIHTS